MHTIIPVILYVIFPMAGLAGLCRLVYLMEREQITAPPVVGYAWLFFCVGGWLLIGLTKTLWYWSGMATLGLFFLIFASPSVTLMILLIQGKHANQSVYHRFGFWATLVYLGVSSIVEGVFLLKYWL
jgi:hypothetical protein